MSSRAKNPRIFNMATFPARIYSFADAVNSILPQCDRLNIYLNQYNHIPDFLNHPKINAVLSGDEMGNLGDVGKFFRCDQWTEGYVFTVDDKFIYPPDYASLLISKVEEYDKKAVVSCHGRILELPCTSYYNQCKEFFGLLGTVRKDTFAHELGTGAMCFHTDTLMGCNLSLDIFPRANMTDIYFSMFLQKHRIPILIARHSAGWTLLNTKHDESYSIHNTFNHSGKDQPQTDLVNSFDWMIHEPVLAH